jgi:hypothetical protein
MKGAAYPAIKWLARSTSYLGDLSSSCDARDSLVHRVSLYPRADRRLTSLLATREPTLSPMISGRTYLVAPRTVLRTYMPSQRR